MDDKKSFFELLDPKSALIVGLTGGLLSLGTLGFLVLGTVMLKDASVSTRTPAVVAAVGQQNAVQPEQTPPPNVPKTAKPKVELFVMSYCPYGLQMEKAYLPAWDLLKNKADIDLKFVSYAMHGKKEVDENTRQYCIQSEQPTKFQAYLKCFFGAGSNDGQEANYKSCLTAAGVSQTSLTSCMTRTDKKFAITAKFNDTSSWLSGQFPQYPIHADLNSSYGVQGSPTLVINGVQADAARTPEAIKQAICNAFTTAPSECAQALSTSSFNPGFGTSLSAAGAAGSAAAGCGT